MKAPLAIILTAVLAITACQQAAPNPFPEATRAEFYKICRREAPKCDCAWDTITRSMTADEYNAALKSFEKTGVMDRRIVRASVDCTT